MTMRWLAAGACALLLAACEKADSTRTADAVLVLDKTPD